MSQNNCRVNQNSVKGQGSLSTNSHPIFADTSVVLRDFWCNGCDKHHFRLARILSTESHGLIIRNGTLQKDLYLAFWKQSSTGAATWPSIHNMFVHKLLWSVCTVIFVFVGASPTSPTHGLLKRQEIAIESRVYDGSYFTTDDLIVGLREAWNKHSQGNAPIHPDDIFRSLRITIDDHSPPLIVYFEAPGNVRELRNKDAFSIIERTRAEILRQAYGRTLDALVWAVRLNDHHEAPVIARGVAIGNPRVQDLANLQYEPGQLYPLQDLAHVFNEAARSVTTSYWNEYQPIDHWQRDYNFAGSQPTFRISVQMLRQQGTSQQLLLGTNLRHALATVAVDLEVEGYRRSRVSGVSFDIHQTTRDARNPHATGTTLIARVYGHAVHLDMEAGLQTNNTLFGEAAAVVRLTMAAKM